MGTAARRTAIIAAIITSVVLALTGTASATGSGAHQWGRPGWGEHQRCASGQAQGRGANLINTFRFTVCQHSPDPHDVSGYFAAAGTFGTGALIAPQGPVTCADIAGNTVSFLYPLGAGSRPAFPPGTTAILIVATAGGPGTGKIGFVGPAPTATFGNRCDQGSPQAVLAGTAALPLQTGTITVTDRR